MILGIDVGSTTCKYVLVDDRGNILDKAYERHNTKTAEKVYEFLKKLEENFGFKPGRDRVYFTGSGATLIAPLVGGRVCSGGGCGLHCGGKTPSGCEVC
jgi:activator of 2-hydroxyglutaryl-CoA dehydratase